MELDTRERADRVLDAARWRKGDDVFGRVGAEMKCVHGPVQERKSNVRRGLVWRREQEGVIVFDPAAPTHANICVEQGAADALAVRCGA
jgi:hypothetical protein|eukprot:COSAG04_NODE_457_length_14036_cov_27.040109_5_plen_89_part_00